MKFDIVEMSDFSGDMAHIYSIMFSGEEETLLEQFFNENTSHTEELRTIAEKLLVMGMIQVADVISLSIMKVLPQMA